MKKHGSQKKDMALVKSKGNGVEKSFDLKRRFYETQIKATVAIRCIFLCFLVVFASDCLYASLYTYSDGKYTFEYWTIGENQAGLSCYDISPTPVGHLTLPSTIHGRTVTCMNCSYPDINMSGVTSVTFPENLERMYEYALSGTSVKHFNFPKSLRTIGGLGRSLELEELSIPTHVTNISERAFARCPKLRKVHIPNSVGCGFYGWEKVFSGCSNLEEITIDPSPLRLIIGSNCFGGCSSLRKFAILNDESYVWIDRAFETDKGIGVSSLPEVILGTNTCFSTSQKSYGNLKYYESKRRETYATFFNVENPTTVKLDFSRYPCWAAFPFGHTNIETVIIHEGTKSLVEEAFAYCTSIEEVSLNEGLAKIGDRAFAKCTSLKGIDLPETVTNVGHNAFRGCTNLVGITLPNSVTVIGSGAFRDCTGLASVNIGTGVNVISDSSFSGCTSLDGLTIPNTVSIIGGSAFYGCSGLTSVTIPAGVTIGGSAFYGCSGLTSVTIPAGVTIGRSAFYGCSGLTSVVIPDHVMDIGAYAFYECSGLKSLTIGSDVGVISSAAFSMCTNLTNVTVPGNVTNICDETFADCTNLRRATLDNGVKKLGHNVFRGCSRLTNISIPDSVIDLGTYMGASAFSGCSNLVSVTIPQSVCSSRVRNVFPSSYQKMTNIVISGNVTYIGDQVFEDCTNLSKIAIPDCVTNIGSYAFSNCDSLTEVTIGSNVSSIGHYAFRDCSGLTSVTIPKSVKNIGDGAFKDCTNAFEFAFAGEPPNVTGRYPAPFKNVKSGAIGTYPAEYAMAWESVIDDKGYWCGLKMRPSYYTVIYDANNGTGARTTTTVEWGEPTLAGDGTFTWEAHYFMGWAFEDVGGDILGSDDLIPEPQEGNAVTLYGQWATFEPVAADWSIGSITLKATGVATKEGDRVWLSYCDSSGENTDWQYVENSNPTFDDGGQSVCVTDSDFYSRLGGISAVTYRFQIGISLDEIRATMYCTTRTKYGLIVAPGDYAANMVALEATALPFMVDYANMFESLLESNGKVARGNIYTLTGNDANYGKINDSINSIKEVIKPGDICFLYFGTHGGLSGTSSSSLALYDHLYTEEELANHIRTLNTVSESNSSGNGVAVVGFVHACHSAGISDVSADGYCVPNAWCVNSVLTSRDTAWVTATDSPKALSFGEYFSKFLLDYGWSQGWAGSPGTALNCSALATYTKERVDAVFEGITMKNDGDKFEVKVGIYDSKSILDNIFVGGCGRHNEGSIPTDPIISAAGTEEEKITISCENMYYVDSVIKFKKRGDAASYEIWSGDGSSIPLHNGMASINDSDVHSSGRECPYYYQIRTINGAGVGKSNETSAWRVHTESHTVSFMYNSPRSSQAVGAGRQWSLPYDSQLSTIWSQLEESLSQLDAQGYTFTGWYTEPHGRGIRITRNERVLKTITYYANWTGMTQTWLDAHPTIVSASGGDITAAATMTAANGCRTVGECYALGINPEDPNDDLKIADFKIEDGKPVITLNHTKDGSGNSFEPRIKTLGKANLTDQDWIDITGKDQSEYRFFKVTIDLP